MGSHSTLHPRGNYILFFLSLFISLGACSPQTMVLLARTKNQNLNMQLPERRTPKRICEKLHVRGYKTQKHPKTLLSLTFPISQFLHKLASLNRQNLFRLKGNYINRSTCIKLSSKSTSFKEKGSIKLSPWSLWAGSWTTLVLPLIRILWRVEGGLHLCWWDIEATLLFGIENIKRGSMHHAIAYPSRNYVYTCKQAEWHFVTLLSFFLFFFVYFIRLYSAPSHAQTSMTYKWCCDSTGMGNY